MKKIISVIICLVLMCSFSQNTILADTTKNTQTETAQTESTNAEEVLISISADDVKMMKAKSISGATDVLGENYRRNYIKAAADILNSLELTPDDDKSNKENKDETTYIITVVYNDDKITEFSLFGDGFLIGEKKYKISSEQAEKFLEAFDIVNGRKKILEEEIKEEVKEEIPEVTKAPVIPENPEKRQVPVLMYHSVENSVGTYYVTPDKLRYDIASLKSAGYTPVLFEDLIDFVYNGASLPEKPVVLTFDDGYKNNYDTLLPLARELGFKFEVFGVIGGIGYNPRSMNWDEARYLDESEEADLGCHTYNLHYDASRRGVKRNPWEDFSSWEHIFRTDLRYAHTTVCENLGTPPDIFAYPFGAFSAEAEKILRETGYIATVTTEPGINTVEQGNIESLYLMMRISMDGTYYSAVEMINKYSHISTTPAIDTERTAAQGISYASRRDALKALYSDDFEGMTADLSYLNWYADTKYLDEETSRLMALSVSTCKIGGFEDCTIRPYHYITRGEFAVILARNCGYAGESVKYFFTDANDWNYEFISWCAEKGYMQGYGDGTFGVNDFLTLEQLALICERIEKGDK